MLWKFEGITPANNYLQVTYRTVSFPLTLNNPLPGLQDPLTVRRRLLLKMVHLQLSNCRF